MRKLLPARLKQFIRRAIGQPARPPAPPPAPLPGTPPSPLPPDVTRALSLPASDLRPPQESAELAAKVGKNHPAPDAPDSRELFSMNGRPLPCWQDSDLSLYDEWLLARDYYPVYFSLFRELTSPARKSRLLEIGVRTGYLGVVYARAARGPVFYLGVDPNLYVANGLQLASATFRQLRVALEQFDFVLVQGYSWDCFAQNILDYTRPFDFVHVDGDHTLVGKVIDLDLARRLVAPDGYVLVDDYNHHSPIADAIQRAFALGWYRQFAYVPSLRGLAILTV